MSWKGLKKAINRLPHVIQLKTGGAEESIDEEFDLWNEQMQELDQLTGRLADAALKYKEALAAMIKHQESFSKTLLEAYQPIPGKFTSAENLNAPVAFANLPKKDRPLTPDASLKRAQDFYQVSATLSETLIPKLEIIIDRQVLKPIMDYQMLHKCVQKTIIKRSRKKIDYDRHNNQLKKMKDRVGDREDERKIVKMENTVETSFNEYEQVNSNLKVQLPVYIQMRIEFMDPVLEAMTFFQDYYFTQRLITLQPLALVVDMSCSAVEGYQSKKDIAVELIESISILKPMPKTSPTVISPVSGDGEFDDDMSTGVSSLSVSEKNAPPSKPNRSYTSVPPPAYPGPSDSASVSPPLGSSNPFVSSGSSSPSKAPPVVKAKPAFLKTPSNDASASMPPPPPPQRANRSAKVLFDFDAQQSGDLPLKTGDIVELLEYTADTNSWWTGKCNGRQGIFPGSYVQLL